MWWPSPTDQTCTEVTEEKSSRTSPSLKRHSAWGLEELLAYKLSFTDSSEGADVLRNDDAIRTTNLQADVIMDTDVTDDVHDDVIRTEELRKSSMFELLNIHCST